MENFDELDPNEPPPNEWPNASPGPDEEEDANHQALPHLTLEQLVGPPFQLENPFNLLRS